MRQQSFTIMPKMYLKIPKFKEKKSVQRAPCPHKFKKIYIIREILL